MRVGFRTDVGKRRVINQDVVYISDNLPLYIVADGMGGHKAGEVASRMATEILVVEIEKGIGCVEEDGIEDFLKKAIEKANTNVYLESLKSDDYTGMGTTVTLAYVYNNRIYIGHVGDSRAYKIDLEKNRMTQITEDHSYMNKLLNSGSITIDEARVHPKRNMITRAVGSSSILEVDIYVEDYSKNQLLLLTSDGLTNMLGEGEILGTFLTHDLQKSCDILVERANVLGGTDNISLIVINLE